MNSERAAFFDVDGTLTPANTWNLLLAHPRLGKRVKRRVLARVLPVWLLVKARLKDDADFRQMWVPAVAHHLAGWSRADLDALFEWVVNDQVAGQVRGDVHERLRRHVERGEQVVLVSGMYEGMVQAFARRLGAQGAVGSPLAFDGDRCAGPSGEPGCIGPHKLTYLRRYLREHDLSPDFGRSFAYADSFSDVPLLSSVGHAVAVYPDADLLAHARARQWEVLGASAG